jgi:hypothetical protein
LLETYLKRLNRSKWKWKWFNIKNNIKENFKQEKIVPIILESNKNLEYFEIKLTINPKIISDKNIYQFEVAIPNTNQIISKNKKTEYIVNIL